VYLTADWAANLQAAGAARGPVSY